MNKKNRDDVFKSFRTHKELIKNNIQNLDIYTSNNNVKYDETIINLTKMFKDYIIKNDEVVNTMQNDINTMQNYIIENDKNIALMH